MKALAGWWERYAVAVRLPFEGHVKVTAASALARFWQFEQQKREVMLERAGNEGVEARRLGVVFTSEKAVAPP